MKRIYSVKEICSKYDVFLVDVYGVLYNGDFFFERALDTLISLRDAGKAVILLSNASCTPSEAESSYCRKGMLKFHHYDEVVTSGGEMLEYVRGLSNISHVFTKNNSIFQTIDGVSLDDAEYIYIGVPKYHNKDIDISDLYDDNGEKVTIDKLIESDWSTITNSYGERILDEIYTVLCCINGTALCANPDIFAQEKVAEQTCNVLRQGAVAMKYEQLGRNVVYTGKPYKNIYNTALKNYSGKVIMVGDTPWTDIAGANNVGIDSLLVLSGSFQAFSSSGISINDFILHLSKRLCSMKNCNMHPTYVIDYLM